MLIGATYDKIGILPLSEAIKSASEASLDLVQVSPPDSNPVVCKLLDYGKHLFDKKKVFHLQKLKLKETPLKKLNLGLQQMLVITILN